MIFFIIKQYKNGSGFGIGIPQLTNSYEHNVTHYLMQTRFPLIPYFKEFLWFKLLYFF